MHTSLLRVIRTVVHADSDPARQTLFAHLRESRTPVRIVYWLHQHLGSSWLSALLVSGYGLAALLRIAASDNRDARLLVVASQANARRQTARIMSWIGTTQCDWVRTRTRSLLNPAHVAAVGRALVTGRVLRTLRILRAIDARSGFLVACRVAAAIAWYARSKAILADATPAAVLVSSDSNPEEAGFVGAARALRIPQIFVSHAYPTPFSPPLDFTLSILEGEAAVQAHRRKGPIRGRVLLAGIEGESIPLDPRRLTRRAPVIGVFPPKAFSWPKLAAIIDECRTVYRATEVVIRWHPSTLEPPRLAQVLTDRARVVESPKDAGLADVARRCDWVIAAENSNVHLPVLKLGIPTVVVKGLGLYPENRADLYGFVSSGIIFPPVASLSDIDVDAFMAFFSACWRERFADYDASYLRPATAVEHEIRRVIERLLQTDAAPVTAR